MTVASSDDHNGQPGKRGNGATALVAPRLDRAAVFEGLRSGTTYGTTGERVLLDFSIDGRPMGSTIRVAAGARLTGRIEVHGTGPLDTLEVFRFVPASGRDWETAFVRRDIGAEDATFEWREPAQAPAIFYARVTERTVVEVQVPVYHARPVTAWSSPIWIDATEK